MSVREFYEKHNKIVIVRHSRGIGDILMHRMIFEDIKKSLSNDMKLIFACPQEYHPLVQNHPYIDEIADSRIINRFNYLISYETTACDIIYECSKAPNGDKPRPDIWAEHCGVKLKNHNMFCDFLKPEMIQFGHYKLKQLRLSSYQKYNKNGPSVHFCPFAYDNLRTLTEEQIVETVRFLRSKGLFVYSSFYNTTPLLDQLEVPVIQNISLLEWLGTIHVADYVVTVDTGTFHYAGGINKPLTGIFTYADGKLRGKYYDFILVQKHKDNGDWPCGPCYNHVTCSHRECKNPASLTIPKPCLTKLTSKEINEGIEKMLIKWSK